MRRVGDHLKTRILSCQHISTKNLSSRIQKYPIAEMQRQESRLDQMISMARDSGITLDDIHEMSVGLDDNSFRQLMGRLSSSPTYMYSSVIPYRSRRARAPSRPTLDAPDSQFLY